MPRQNESLFSRLFFLPQVLKFYYGSVIWRSNKPRLVRYGLACVVALFALYIKLFIDIFIPIQTTPFLFTILPVIGITWYGGIGAAIVGLLFTAITTRYYFMNPMYSLSLADDYGLVRLSLYLIEGGVSIWLTDLTQMFRYTSTIRLQKLKDSEEGFNLLTNTAPVLIWITNCEDTFLYMNKKWTDSVGMSLADISHYKVVDFIHTNDKSRYIECVSEAYKKNKSYRIQYRLKIKNKYRWVLHNGVPLPGLYENMQGYLNAAVSIDKEKELDEKKSRFISVTSHELKTPLTTIKAFSQLLEKQYEKLSPQERQYYLSKVIKQVNKLAVFVDGLLDLSRIERGRFIIQKELFAMDEVITEVANDIRLTVVTHAIIIKKNAKIQIYADRYKISQVLYNLLDNAIKFSPLAKKVVIASYSNDNKLVVEVTDLGVGILQKSKRSIFELFEQIEPQKKMFYRGLGIGLYISKEIIDKHGGQIGIKRSTPRGSTFYFTLPLNKNK